MSSTIRQIAPEDLVLPEVGDWWLLHVRSRQEKVIAADLQAMGIGFYLPLLRKVRFHGKRKVTVVEPMFSSYVFLRGSREDAFSADRTKRVANIIRVHDQEHIDWELRNLHQAIQYQAPLDPYPYLKEGVRVEVRSGPFRGLQGLVEKRGEDDRLLLQIDMLGRAMSLEIEASLLEPIG